MSSKNIFFLNDSDWIHIEFLISAKEQGLSIADIDEKKYPEYYRKLKNSTLDRNLNVPKPMDIGYITEIFTLDGTLYIKVKKLFRPENTLLSKKYLKNSSVEITKQLGINLLFWGDEGTFILLAQVKKFLNNHLSH